MSEKQTGNIITDEIGLKNLDGCITTVTGKKLILLNPKPEDICIEDIAAGLAFKGHFAGQTKHGDGKPRFFSIAQHCCIAVQLMPEALKKENPMLAFACLMHDAAEAFLADLPKPFKVHDEFYVQKEKQLQAVIFEKYGIPIELLPEIKKYDHEAQEVERLTFFKGEKDLIRDFFTPEQSYEAFLSRFVYWQKEVQR